jgi:putative NIF3 family GTP cyclohydrolase 1 type 2
VSAVYADNCSPTIYDCSSITPINEAPAGFEQAGYGRIVRFKVPEDLGTIMLRVAEGLGDLSALSVATPQSVQQSETRNMKISSIGICAGSGGSLLNGLDVDLLLTGELSHHEALAAIEQGKCVITAFHSNTERAFLKSRMLPALSDQLQIMAASKGAAEWGLESGFEIAVSKVDRDPFEIITMKNQNIG